MTEHQPQTAFYVNQGFRSSRILADKKNPQFLRRKGVKDVSARRIPSGEMRFAGTACVCVSLCEYTTRSPLLLLPSFLLTCALFIRLSKHHKCKLQCWNCRSLFFCTCLCLTLSRLRSRLHCFVKQDTLVCLIAFYCVISWPRVQRALAVFWVLQRGLTFAMRQARPSAKPEAAIGRAAASLPPPPPPHFSPGPASPSGPTEP